MLPYRTIPSNEEPYWFTGGSAITLILSGAFPAATRENAPYRSIPESMVTWV